MNAIIELNEECDDGDVLSGNGCSVECIDEACTAGVDTDSDRLDDCTDLALGSNKTMSDTDGDGFGDGHEVLGTENGLDLSVVQSEKARCVPFSA